MHKKKIKKLAWHALIVCLFFLYVWGSDIRPDYVWHEQAIEKAKEDDWTLIYYSSGVKDLFRPWTWVWPPISYLYFTDLNRVWVNQQGGSNIGLLPVLEIKYNIDEKKRKWIEYVLLVNLDDYTFGMWTADEVYKLAEDEEAVVDFQKEKWYPNFISSDFEAAIWNIFDNWSVRIRRTDPH